MTIAIIIITSLITIISFGRPDLMSKMQFNPYRVYHKKEYYRLFTHAFLHADWVHLIINMFVLFSFGTTVEHYFKQLAIAGILNNPNICFLILYVLLGAFQIDTRRFSGIESTSFSSILATAGLVFVSYASTSKVISVANCF